MTPFQGDQSFHSLHKFSAKNELLDFFPGICDKIRNDMRQPIIYIHPKNIVHRDIKPTNILVNNLHSRNASKVDAIALFRKNPLICKLTDLGEARSKLSKHVCWRKISELLASVEEVRHIWHRKYQLIKLWNLHRLSN